MISEVIIEFEGYNLRGRFIYKELVINVLSENEENDIKHFFIRPPFAKDKLKQKDLKNVLYCERYLHKIKWDSGNVRMSEVTKVLNSLPSNSIVYTKGLQKKLLLEPLLPFSCDVIDLEDNLKCPRISVLCSKGDHICPLRFHWNTFNCAYLKAVEFGEYVKHERTN